MRYTDFIRDREQTSSGSGFEPIELPDCLFPFQRHLTDWALRMGRAAIFADCGLGKTLMQLVWADNVARHTGKPVLILTPLAVGQQTIVEGKRFGFDVTRSQDGTPHKWITVTNYERLEHFNADDWGGVDCDESSIIKSFGGKTRKLVTQFMKRVPYRLLCTATAAPNDFHELGTSSEALGYLGYRDMLSRFFKEDSAKDFLGWGRKVYPFRGHAAEPFWRWVCSWARACRRPSDIGFSDEGFGLPPLLEHEYTVRSEQARPGMLFATPAVTLDEQRDERRSTIGARCDEAAQRVAEHDGASVVWCHLNEEGDRLEKSIKGAVQVKGSMSLDEKEARLIGFSTGEHQAIITKPKIGCWGLNWQHCHNVVTFASHSWEQYYQAVRRCLRFGQQHPVKVSIVTSECESRVLSNLQRKAKQADEMFAALVRHMSDSLAIDVDYGFTQKTEVPRWL